MVRTIKNDKIDQEGTCYKFCYKEKFIPDYSRKVI